MPFAITWLDLDIITLNKPGKDKHCMIDHLYVESKVLIQINLSTK